MSIEDNQPPSYYMKKIFKGSKETEILEKDILQIVKIADKLMKLLINDERGFNEYDWLIKFDDDILDSLGRFNYKERNAIINKVLREYFTIEESKNEEELVL